MTLCWGAPNGAAHADVAVADLLRAFGATGADVLFSSDLVPSTLRVPVPTPGTSPLRQIEEALTAHDLRLKRIDDQHFVVTRIPPVQHAAPAKAAGPQPLAVPIVPEILVFASHYSLQTDGNGEPSALDERAIDQVPGTEVDALRALRAVPGLASTYSARPYIRGGTANEVQFRFDEVTLTNPFHFRAFESLLSPFLPADVERIDLYSGGYPVRFGNSTAGVIDVAPRSATPGYDLSADASHGGADLAGSGALDRWPIEWLASIRHSPDETNVLQPIDADPVEPVFFDALARARWIVRPDLKASAGWLLLDDHASAQEGSRDELAAARSRDQYLWLAADWAPLAALQSHTSVSYTQSQSSHAGTLELAGLAAGSLQEAHAFTTYALRTEWTYLFNAGLSWNAGVEFADESASLHYAQSESFTSVLGPGFALQPLLNTVSDQRPRASSLSEFVSAKRNWQAFEAEIGVRLDTQDYRGFGMRTQLTPRLNLRFDPATDWHVYGSLGEFSQAQRVDELRAEQNQTTPDPASRALHSVLGLAREPQDALRWRVEVYRDHWSSVSPYYDNALGVVTLLPELQPDRILIAPLGAESDGVELSVRQSLGSHLTAWGTYALSRVVDELPAGDVPRSWDQRHALNLGVSWQAPRTTASLLLGWHSGWPRTALGLIPATSAMAAYLQAGAANQLRWGGYLSLDMHLAERLETRVGELSVWLDVINAGNESNQCCTELNPDIGTSPGWTTDTWPGRSVNLGLSWRLQHDR